MFGIFSERVKWKEKGKTLVL